MNNVWTNRFLPWGNIVCEAVTKNVFLYKRGGCNHACEDLPKWLKNEETERSTHKTTKTWMKVDSIHVRVHDPRNDVIGAKEAELLKTIKSS